MSDNWPDPDLIEDFLAEAEEHLDSVDAALLELERQRSQRSSTIVQAALRGLHSVKGTAGYVSLFDVQELCHAGESLLHGIETAANGRERLDLSFDGVSVLRQRLSEVRQCCKAGHRLPASKQVSEFIERSARALEVGGDGASRGRARP